MERLNNLYIKLLSLSIFLVLGEIWTLFLFDIKIIKRLFC